MNLQLVKTLIETAADYIKIHLDLSKHTVIYKIIHTNAFIYGKTKYLSWQSKQNGGAFPNGIKHNLYWN